MTTACGPRIQRFLTACALAAAVATWLSGCAVASFQTARTLPEGRSQFYVAPSSLRLSVGGAPVGIPFLELGTRYGLTDEVELGARVGAGLGLDAKVALARTPTPTTGWDIAIAPGVGYIGNFSGTPTGSGGDELHFVGATLPALFTRHLGATFSVTAGPRIMYLMQYVETDTGQATHVLSIGSSLSVAARVSDGFAPIVEVAFATPVYRALTNFGSDLGLGGGATLQLGIGFVFGG